MDIVLHSLLSVKSPRTEYNSYKTICTPLMNEKLTVLKKPDKEKDKHVLCVKKENVFVPHLP